MLSYLAAALMMALVLVLQSANARQLRFLPKDLDEKQLQELLGIAQQPPVPRHDTCWFCFDEDFSGGCLERGVGEYPDLTGHNDQYESIICGADVHSEVFAAVDFRADHVLILGAERSLRASGWSNRISSLKVRRNPGDQLITITDQGTYQGRPYLKGVTFVPRGLYDLGPLQNLGLLRNGQQIHEIIVPNRYTIILGSHPRTFTLQSISNGGIFIISRGEIVGARRSMGPGRYDLRELTFQDDNGQTVTWAEGLQAFRFN